MTLPEQPVTLSVEHIAELSRELREMRHEINNHASKVVAAAELIRAKPELTERMTATLIEQPAKISEAMQKFSGRFEEIFGIKRN